MSKSESVVQHAGVEPIKLSDGKVPKATPTPDTRNVQPGQRIPGKYYLVIQGLLAAGDENEQKASGTKIVEFLAANGEKADVCYYQGTPKQWVVWSLQPFDSDTDDKAKEYAVKIEDLGKKFKAQGGKYNFKQHDASGNMKAWYVHMPSK